MENNTLLERLMAAPLSLGAARSAIIGTDRIVTDEAFRRICESNSCGMYGKCWMCPPHVGEIGALMGEIGKYDHALVYQTVSQLEDSYDFEGMIEAKKRCYPLARGLREVFDSLKIQKTLHLGVGGCGICETCAKREEQPCRYPTLAMASLESYGIYVAKLAEAAGMKYINGADTVTYFGAVLFSLSGEET